MKQFIKNKASLMLCMLSAMSIATSCKWFKQNVAGLGTHDTKILEITEASLDSLRLTSNSDTLLYMEYDYHFLKSDGIVADSINAGIVKYLVNGTHDTDVAEALRQAMKKEESAMLSEIQEFYRPDDETFGIIKYEIIQNGRFESDAADTIIAYTGTSYRYTGGAHGSYQTNTVNFSGRTGRLVRIDDILDTAHEKEILKLMLSKLLSDNDCATREELMEKTGILALGELYLTENFRLGKDSITFCFGQYEIAPYSSGITYIGIGYDSLSPYLRIK